MRKSLVALLLAAGAAAFVANLAFAATGESGDNMGPKLMNAAMAKDLQSRALRLGSSATSVDTTYVGFTPGHKTATNYWSIWSGNDKFSAPTGPYHRPPGKGGMWDFDGPYTDVSGDSLQGWWSIRVQMSGTGGLTIPDYLRPWRALDFGNIANYEFGKCQSTTASSNKRTFGVVGVWHVDGGNNVVVPTAPNDGLGRSTTPNWGAETDGGVKWAPLGGTKSAWMGLRRHGDVSAVDPITNNAFNEDVMQWNWFTSSSTGGTDKKYPGYAGQMDQMLYRDVDVTGATNISVSFKYRTSMSTGFGTANTSRTGWFVHDPLAVITGGSNPNFIQNNSSVAAPPVDSLMVYVGAPADGSVLLSDGNVHTIYDPLRRWFGEVLRSNEGLYKEIFTIGGTHASTSVGPISTPVAGLAVGNKVRVVFRVKTN